VLTCLAGMPLGRAYNASKLHRIARRYRCSSARLSYAAVRD
jgi:hypothetical protein